MALHDDIALLREQTIFTRRHLTVVNELLRLPTGRVAHHLTLRHPGAVVCLPYQHDGTLLTIQQYRHSIRQILLEFPAGTLEPGEDPLVCAQRELAEEVGQQANSWEPLGTFHPAPGFCSEIQYGFLAKDLTPCPMAPEDDELIEIVPMHSAEVERAICDGRMSDSKSIALYMRAKLRGLI